MLQGILGFLFGKAPDIFDENGQVVHKFPPDKWKQWNDRFHKPEYNWHHHRGTERKVAAPKK